VLGNENNTASLYQSQAAWNSCSLTRAAGYFHNIGIDLLDDLRLILFWAPALVEYLGALPDGFKWRSTQTKRILHAFADIVPAQIMKRGKMGFGVPLAIWFRGDLRGYMGDMLAPGARLYRLSAASGGQAPVRRACRLARRSRHEALDALDDRGVAPFASGSGLQEGDL
jgi:Asparagine synthase